MKLVLQRVRDASVTVDNQLISQIGPGFLVLAGIAETDTTETLSLMAQKVVNLRVFEDDAGKMNLSLLDTGGSLLVVSQFTLFADCRKGRRPNFLGAAPPAIARKMFEQFVTILRQHVPDTQSGVFQAMMEVRLNNWGPVTIVLDSTVL